MKKFKLENTRLHSITLSIRQDKNGVIIPLVIPPAVRTGATGSTSYTNGSAIVDEDMLTALKNHLVVKGYFAMGWLKVEDAPDDADSDHEALTREEANDESKLNINNDDMNAQVEAAQAAAKVAKDAADQAQKTLDELNERAAHVQTAADNVKKTKTKVDKTALIPTGEAAGNGGGISPQPAAGDGTGTGTGAGTGESETVS